MQILRQDTLSTPKDWSGFDSSLWNQTAKRGVPEGLGDGENRHNASVDSTEGWIYALCVMGTIFRGYDHYAVEHLLDGKCQVTAWKDDLRHWTPEQFVAYQATYWPLRPDNNLGGAINSYGEKIIYVGGEIGAYWKGLGPIQNTVIKPWAEFAEPSASLTRHGIYISDELSEIHSDVRGWGGWRQWTEGVDPSLIDDNGILKKMRPLGLYRKALGTKTFFGGVTALANGVYAASNERQFESTAQATSEDEAVATGADELAYLHTTQSGEPNEGTWPTGDYRCQIDADTVHSGITFGLRAVGGSTGAFKRVDSGLTSEVDTQAQIESVFSDPGGLKLATTGSISWSGSTASDRFCCLVAAAAAADHGNLALNFTYDADWFADGPWTEADGSRLLLINPPGLDGGFGGNISL